MSTTSMSKKCIFMYACAFTFLGVAVMLLVTSPYIMGSSPMFGRAEVTIQSVATVKHIERVKEEVARAEAVGGEERESCYYHNICTITFEWAKAVERNAIPIDDSIIAKFPRTDEFRKAFKVLEERHHDPDECLGGPIMSSADICDITNIYEFEIGKADADALRSVMKELALQHGKSKDERSAVVRDYGLNKDIVTQGNVITVRYNNIYYHIGVATYSIP
ncbi:MAG: hypothetical protein QW248_03745 [Candidatus Nitrosocaldus sp.]